MSSMMVRRSACCLLLVAALLMGAAANLVGQELPPPPPPPPPQAAGVFVGINRLDGEDAQVGTKYAVDDAIAQADFFVKLKLIPASNVTLVYSGKPFTEAAKNTKDELVKGGARILPGERDKIWKALENAASLVRTADDRLFISLCAECFEEDKVPYLLPADGSRDESKVPSAINLVTLQRKVVGAWRTLLLVDGVRSTARPVQPLSLAFKKAFAEGRNLSAVLSCEVNQSSFESQELQQGLFTHFLVDGKEEARRDDEWVGLLRRLQLSASDWVKRNTTDGRAQVPCAATFRLRVLAASESIRSKLSDDPQLAADLKRAFDGARPDADGEALLLFCEGVMSGQGDATALKTALKDYLRVDAGSHPTSAADHYALAVQLRRAGDLDNALAHAKEAVKLDPENFEYVFRVADIVDAQGLTDEAYATYVQCDSLIEKGYHLARNRIGVILYNWGRYSEAVDMFRSAHALYPKDARYVVNMGRALLKAGRTIEGRNAFKHALEIDPNSAEAQRELDNVERFLRNR